MDRLREFLRSTGGKVAAIALVLLAVLLAYYSVRSNFGNDLAAISADRMFVDAKTGQPFEHTISIGEHFPVKAPSGGNTGYPAEKCYWAKDGSVKKNPTPVLLNSWIGKSGPTFCPECGRLVVGHNPYPEPGAKPPPNEAEYKASRGGGGSEPGR
jgi:hypothetical protein